MLTAKIFCKVLPNSTGLTPGSGGPPEITWQDVLLALQGVTGKEEGFIRYVYMDDPRGRHDFFAGLFREAMNRSEIQQWLSKNNKKGERTGDVERMVYMAMAEWKTNKRDEHGNPINENSRAITMGVSRGVWARKYTLTYSSIVAMPAYWLDEVMRLATHRL